MGIAGVSWLPSADDPQVREWCDRRIDDSAGLTNAALKGATAFAERKAQQSTNVNHGALSASRMGADMLVDRSTQERASVAKAALHHILDQS